MVIVWPLAIGSVFHEKVMLEVLVSQVMTGSAIGSTTEIVCSKGAEIQPFSVTCRLIVLDPLFGQLTSCGPTPDPRIAFPLLKSQSNCAPMLPLRRLELPRVALQRGPSRRGLAPLEKAMS